MKNVSSMKKVLIGAALALVPALWAADCLAGSQALGRVRVGNLVNVDDPAGRWQHEGGNILKNGVNVGKYAITRRVTFSGTSTYNTAMETVTLFFPNGNSAPHNITLEGAHSFNNGYFTGSVSGASGRYNWLQGADVVMTPATLYIYWTGSAPLVLP